MILLGKNPGIVQSHINSQSESNEGNEQYILADALKRAKIECSKEDKPQDDFEKFPDQASNTSSGTTSTLSAVSENIVPNSERDGLFYIAGYLAKKHREEFPEIGCYTYALDKENIHSYSMPSWVQSLSFGGLIQPSEEWAENVQILEKYFKKFHNATFKKCKHIVKRTTAYLCKHNANLPKKLVESFARQRIFMRIKYLNSNCSNVSLKRKRETDSERKVIKKMKKILN